MRVVVRLRVADSNRWRPVHWSDGELRNDDASALLAASGLDLPYATVNPYCFAPAIAPTSPRRRSRVRSRSILAAFERWRRAIRGGRGRRRLACPLGPDLDIQRLALALGLPVILAVGLRLGCLNHARSASRRSKASGAMLLGVGRFAGRPGMPRLQENIATLEVGCCPCLGVMLHWTPPGRLRTSRFATEHRAGALKALLSHSPHALNLRKSNSG